MVEVEVCANSVRSVIAAQRAGANRVELCVNLSEGGLTPFLSMIEKSLSMTDIEVNVLVRPRSGDFLYDDIDFDLMKKDIEWCGKLGCSGVVFGILTRDGSIDKMRCAELVTMASRYNMSVTFHRAFDHVFDVEKALFDIIELGCKRILTSGGFPTAVDGVNTIKRLVDLSEDRIQIMPGGGIIPQNVENLIIQTGVKAVHGSFLSPIESKMDYLNPNFSPETDFIQYYSDEKIIKKVVDIAAKF